MHEKKLFEGEVLLQKFPGKGGWTYASLPNIKTDKTKAFGWRKVKGSIDDYKFNDFRLMPMGDGSLFLSINQKIRKIINKYSGDYVKVIVFEDHSEFVVPQYILDCIDMENDLVKKNFSNLNNSKKREFVKYIESVKSDEARSKRILLMIRRLENEK